jgi:arabinofuranosyltransferase
VLIGFPVVVLAAQAWDHRWIADDGFINFHIVDQIAAGNGPVFNAGQRVEAFTSPLWLGVLAVGELLTPVRLEWFAVWVGLIATAAGLAFAIAGAAVLAREASDRDGWLVPAGALVPLALLPIWYFATSGLETSLVFAWQGTCLLLLARWARDDGPLPWWAAVVVGLGWLIRPELGLFSLVFAAVVLAGEWRRQGWMRRIGFVATVFALPAAYQVFRMGYYGSVIPNTALAKEASLTRWSTGWTYLKESFSPYWVWIPLLALIIGAYVPLVRSFAATRRWRLILVIGAFVLGAVLDALYIVRVGGDYIHARLLLPAVFALAAPVAVVILRPRYLAALAVVPWALVCTFWLRSDTAVPYVLPSQKHKVTVEQLGWGPGGPYRKWFTGPAVYFGQDKLKVPRPPGLHEPTVASWGIGIGSYALGTDLQVVDMLGLADTLDAHFELVRRGLPGHEKTMPAPWTAARITAPGSTPRIADFPPPPLVFPLVPWPETDAQFNEQIRTARAALQCPAIRDLLDRPTRPMTFTRFFSNMFHSISDARMRIPPQPDLAFRKYCGRGSVSTR